MFVGQLNLKKYNGIKVCDQKHIFEYLQKFITTIRDCIILVKFETNLKTYACVYKLQDI